MENYAGFCHAVFDCILFGAVTACRHCVYSLCTVVHSFLFSLFSSFSLLGFFLVLPSSLFQLPLQLCSSRYAPVRDRHDAVASARTIKQLHAYFITAIRRAHPLSSHLAAFSISSRSNSCCRSITTGASAYLRRRRKSLRVNTTYPDTGGQTDPYRRRLTTRTNLGHLLPPV